MRVVKVCNPRHANLHVRTSARSGYRLFRNTTNYTTMAYKALKTNQKVSHPSASQDTLQIIRSISLPHSQIPQKTVILNRVTHRPSGDKGMLENTSTPTLFVRRLLIDLDSGPGHAPAIHSASPVWPDERSSCHADIGGLLPDQ